MTTRNKVLLVSSMILAVLVITSVVVWEIIGQSNEKKLPVVLIVTIIVISLLSVFVVYFSKIQKKKRHRYQSKEL